ncbi:glycosyltransferase [Vibrio sinensis]|uniref:Glycosyltransferase n=1 Tax=Vibrio sinensis TaxID=2302434 RepID=A0A3A6Q6W6_9VIBR|nr:glycosyltransferase family 4 protein [Vibrio sinensis]RJX66485.1 glycosyltransferase [Vibrio sinensis]
MKRKLINNDVWLVIDSFTLGGIETHVEQLASGLRNANQPVSVWLVTRYPTPSLLAERLEALSIPVYYINDKNTSATHFYQQLINEKPLAVHAHGYKASLLTKIVCLFTSTPQITTYHAGETPQGRVRLYDWFDRYSALLSKRSIAVSDKISKKLPVVPLRFNNFIETSDIEPSLGHQIAFVGRVSHEKAPDRFKQLSIDLPKLDFHIYGDGPLVRKIISQSPNNLFFHGYQNDMAETWNSIGVLVICSRYEGLPLTALEAMARGIIVIATDVGDLSRLIQNGHNGFLVKSSQQIAHKLNYFFSLSHSVQTRLRENARKTINARFSTDSVMPNLIRIYRNMRAQNHSQFKKNTL